jgi:hypothetical protein
MKITQCFTIIVVILNVFIIPLVVANPVSQQNAVEWWIEVEIYSLETDQTLNDEILIDLHENIIQQERTQIVTWHFFREPTLRFRLEIINKDNRDRIADEIDGYLQSLTTIEDHYFALHGNRINNLDEGYAGEREDYQRMWPYQKKIWEWGAEMTVEAIKEKELTKENNPSRKVQLTRTYHLLANQLSPGFDREYSFRLDNAGGPLVYWYLTISFVLGALASKLFTAWRTRK